MREKYRPGLVTMFLHFIEGEGAAVDPIDDTQRILFEFIKTRNDDGSLRVWWNELRLYTHLAEWRMLATTPCRGDWGPALVCKSSTPGVWEALQRIFVLMVHATRVESSVSKQKQLEHSNMKGRTVNSMWVHHASMEDERAKLIEPSMRASIGGGCRVKALERNGKRLASHLAYGNKRQRQVYAVVMLTHANSYTHEELYRRGKSSLRESVTQSGRRLLSALMRCLSASSSRSRRRMLTQQAVVSVPHLLRPWQT